MATVEPDTGLVEGFAFDRLTSSQKVAERVWTFKIPISQPGKNHLQVIFKPQLEHVHSLGRVLGELTHFLTDSFFDTCLTDF